MYNQSQATPPQTSSSHTLPPFLSRWLTSIVSVLLLVAVAVVALVAESDYLFRVQELNLFLSTRAFFADQMAAPAGWLSWCGTMLTQLFYHPWLGIAVLVVLWGLLIALVRHTFRLSEQWSTWALLPIAFLVISCFHLDYWIYYQKLQGYFFAGTIGTLGMVALVAGYRWTNYHRFLAPLYILVAAIVGYVLMGVYGEMALLLMALLAAGAPLTTKQKALHIACAVLGGVVVPLVCYQWLYCRTALWHLYWVGMPLFCVDGKWYLPYYLPYIYLAVVLLLMSVTTWRRPQIRHRALALVLWAAPVVISVMYVWTSWYKDNNFHTELTMCRAINQCRYDDALDAASKAPHPTRSIWTMKNIALMHKGQLGNQMYHYPNESNRSRAPFDVRMVHTVGKMVYLCYGQANYCYRWCMEDGVEFGWRIEDLVLMLKCSLLNGEDAAARKYVDLLRQTWFYKDLADHYAAYIHHPERVKNDPELAMIRRLMGAENKLTSDNTTATVYLLNHFVHVKTHDSLLQEQALAWSLQSRDTSLIIPRYQEYVRLHPRGVIPTHYQEAAWLLSEQGCQAKMDLSRINDDVKQSYAAFMQAAQQYRGMSLQDVQQALYPSFGNTYYYEFLLNQPQKAE